MKNIAYFIRAKRKELGFSQKQLANKLAVTEKTIIKWENGTCLPSPFLLKQIANLFSVSISTIIGEEKNSSKDAMASYYNMFKQKNTYFPMFLSIFCYVISALIFFVYVKLSYTKINVHYFIQFLFILISSIFAILGSLLHINCDLEKIEDVEKNKKITRIILFVYYITLLLNTALFTRTTYVKSYNLIPFKTLLEIYKNTSFYGIFINIMGNFLIFMPLEYFLLTLFSIKGFKKNLALSFFLLLILEVLQYIWKRGVFDVDDILLCVFGMMFFYFIYYYFLKKKRKLM